MPVTHSSPGSQPAINVPSVRWWKRLSDGARLLLSLIRERPRTRFELTELTGLPRSVVAKHLYVLSELGLVLSDARLPSTGGRPPEILSFNAGAGLIAVSDLQGGSTRLALTDLAGTLVHDREEPIELRQAPARVIAALMPPWHALLAEAGRTPSDVAVAAVSVPGLVDPRHGQILEAPGLPDWHGFRVAEALAAECSTLIVVDSDVNFTVAGEQRLQWPMARDLVFVKIGDTVSAGVLAGGRLLRGARGSAGDIAHVPVEGHQETICACGGRGCLTAVASGAALARRLDHLGVATASATQFWAQVTAGVPQACALAREAGHAIGTVVSAMVNIVNPAAVVLGGPIGDSSPVLAAVREEVYRRSRVAATQDLRIQFSSHWTSAVVAGASRIAIEHLFSPDPIALPQEGVLGAAGA